MKKIRLKYPRPLPRNILSILILIWQVSQTKSVRSKSDGAERAHASAVEIWTPWETGSNWPLIVFLSGVLVKKIPRLGAAGRGVGAPGSTKFRFVPHSSRKTDTHTQVQNPYSTYTHISMCTAYWLSSKLYIWEMLMIYILDLPSAKNYHFIDFPFYGISLRLLTNDEF